MLSEWILCWFYLNIKKWVSQNLLHGCIKTILISILYINNVQSEDFQHLLGFNHTFRVLNCMQGHYYVGYGWGNTFWGRSYNDAIFLFTNPLTWSRHSLGPEWSACFCWWKFDINLKFHHQLLQTYYNLCFSWR